MDSITVRNFRCFGDEQSARLAPITLLVGDNSTGKTSMLGLIRALWDAVYADRVPDFREPPFDFGSFDEIVHYSGGDGERPESFAASFVVRPFAPDDMTTQRPCSRHPSSSASRRRRRFPYSGGYRRAPARSLRASTPTARRPSPFAPTVANGTYVRPTTMAIIPIPIASMTLCGRSTPSSGC